MKIFLDTNIFLRLLIRDNNTQYLEVAEIIKKINLSEIRPYTSSIVLLEVLYVSNKLYGVSKNIVIDFLKRVTNLKNMTVIEKTNINKALNLAENINVKLADLIIALQVPNGCKLCTYDKDFSKIDFVEAIDPSEIH